MLFFPDYERFIVDYIENCGFDPKGWNVKEAAAELQSKAGGEHPDSMSADDFTEMLQRWEVK